MKIIPLNERAPDVEAYISLNTNKKHPVISGYRPTHRVRGDYLTTGVHKYYDVESIKPGQTVLGTITFITPEVYPKTLWIGKQIDICEGEIIVGTATITKIFNPILQIDKNGR